ncbi:MAG TPA: GNAT family N-acetyltransferase [Herpetosiphonaceae bacterium]|nr:GNAT family N-acetyltransferase [Herpetosiphonaceae bacterium]
MSADRPATIRPATAPDMRAVGRLGALLVRTHHDFDPERFIPATPQTERGYAGFLTEQLADEQAIVLVAERDGAVIGYSYSRIEGTDYMALRGPAGMLHDLIVDPAQRGQGVGRMLLGATCAALAARGAPQIVLSTAARNEGAQRLFAQVGFRPTMIEMTYAPQRPE